MCQLFVIHYYDKAGNEITSQIVNNGEDSHYQHFFMVDDIRPSYGGRRRQPMLTLLNSSIMSTVIRNPWNKTNKFDGC